MPRVLNPQSPSLIARTGLSAPVDGVPQSSSAPPLEEVLVELLELEELEELPPDVEVDVEVLVELLAVRLVHIQKLPNCPVHELTIGWP